MIDSPLPFEEALRSRAVRTRLRTTLRTKDMERLSAEVRERAFWSSAVTSAQFLDRADSLIEKLLKGEISRTEAYKSISQFLEANGLHEPGKSFAKDKKSLSSLARQSVLLDTNIKMAHGYGQWEIGQDPLTLNLYPAQELVRVTPRREPRDWRARWASLGGKVFGGRMIALKNDPIWVRLSRFSLPYPPFDFGSGMGVEPVEREDAERFGLIEADEDLVPETRGFNEELQSSPRLRSERLKEALKRELAGIAEFKPDGTLVKTRYNTPRTAAEQGLPELKTIITDPAMVQPDPARTGTQLENYERLERGVAVRDVLGNPLTLDQNTLNHWKWKWEELNRSGYLERARKTLEQPLEVWEQGNQRAYISAFKSNDGGVRWCIVYRRPNGTVDTFFGPNRNQIEKYRKGTLVYATHK